MKAFQVLMNKVTVLKIVQIHRKIIEFTLEK